MKARSANVRRAPIASRAAAVVQAAAVLLLSATLAVGQEAGAEGDAASDADGAPSAAQQAASSTGPLVLVRGTSEVVDHSATLERVSIADPDIADAVVVSANEVVVNAKATGQTTLLLWDEQGGRRSYPVRVTADAATLQSQFDQLFPDAGLEVSATGNTLLLSGVARDPGMEERALELANSLSGDASVVNQITVPDRGQVALKVRFAEVSRSALDQFGLEAVTGDQEDVGGALGTGQIFSPPDPEDAGDVLVESAQDAVNFFLVHRPSSVQAFIRALQGRGLLKSLAEPTLMAVPGDTASFLAGGEFPYPVLQGGAGGGATGNSVTIQFKEFGIRLNFVPTITNSDAVRLQVAPEVSQLDFANGLEVSGFSIPALLTRRAETAIELSPGQTFAIAGLVDNNLMQSVDKVPLLGDIPILGSLFRSEEMRQDRSELLVLVTPRIVRPTDADPPPVPTGEPETWQWRGELREMETPGDSLPASDSLPVTDSVSAGGADPNGGDGGVNEGGGTGG